MGILGPLLGAAGARLQLGASASSSQGAGVGSTDGVRNSHSQSAGEARKRHPSAGSADGEDFISDVQRERSWRRRELSPATLKRHSAGAGSAHGKQHAASTKQGDQAAITATGEWTCAICGHRGIHADSCPTCGRARGTQFKRAYHTVTELVQDMLDDVNMEEAHRQHYHQRTLQHGQGRQHAELHDHQQLPQASRSHPQRRADRDGSPLGRRTLPSNLGSRRQEEQHLEDQGGKGWHTDSAFHAAGPDKGLTQRQRNGDRKAVTFQNQSYDQPSAGGLRPREGFADSRQTPSQHMTFAGRRNPRELAGAEPPPLPAFSQSFPSLPSRAKAEENVANITSRSAGVAPFKGSIPARPEARAAEAPAKPAPQGKSAPWVFASKPESSTASSSGAQQYEAPKSQPMPPPPPQHVATAANTMDEAMCQQPPPSPLRSTLRRRPGSGGASASMPNLPPAAAAACGVGGGCPAHAQVPLSPAASGHPLTHHGAARATQQPQHPQHPQQPQQQQQQQQQRQRQPAPQQQPPLPGASHTMPPHVVRGSQPSSTQGVAPTSSATSQMVSEKKPLASPLIAASSSYPPEVGRRPSGSGSLPVLQQQPQPQPQQPAPSPGQACTPAAGAPQVFAPASSSGAAAAVKPRRPRTPDVATQQQATRADVPTQPRSRGAIRSEERAVNAAAPAAARAAAADQRPKRTSPAPVGDGDDPAALLEALMMQQEAAKERLRKPLR